MQLILNRTVHSSQWDLYMESFPPEERRSKEQHEKIIHDSRFMPFNIHDDDNELLGFLNCWDCGDFIHVEHFAVFPSARNGGIGRATIEYLKALMVNKTIIVEVDLGVDELSKRRIEFYKRQGFQMTDYEYVHPSYSDYEPYRLNVMSYPEALSQKEFEAFREFAFSVL